MNDAPESPEPAAARGRACIGIFDSGVGGLSILLALRERLPDTSVVYVGDVAHAPYGGRNAREIIDRSQQIVQWLEAQGATMIVVACNTATVVAIEALRARRPHLAFVGVEPGVKPAAARSRTRRIAVMATAPTARSQRLRHLIERYAEDAHVHVQPCPGLADAIEGGVTQGQALLAVLKPYCDAIREANVDVVVLGCTHYPFVEASIRELLGSELTIIDTAAAVAERSASLWQQSLPALNGEPAVRVLSTGATDTMRSLLARSPSLADIAVEVLTIIPGTLPG